MTGEDLKLAKEEARFARLVGKQARDVWAKAKRDNGLARYAGKADLARVAEYAELCYRRCDTQDIMKAARIVGAMNNGAPWMLAEEAQGLCATRLALEHEARRMADRQWASDVKASGGLMKHLDPNRG